MENDIKLKFQVYANQRSCKIKIKFLSDEAIIAWGSRILPDGTIVGEITFPGTINYKTKKPVLDLIRLQLVFPELKYQKIAYSFFIVFYYVISCYIFQHCAPYF